MEQKTYEFGCLMVTFEIPHWNKYTVNYIDDVDVYKDDDLGIETEPHITLVYGFDANVTANDLKSYCLPLHQIGVTFNAINSFQNEKYDVLKFECSSPQLSFMHTMLMQDFQITSNFPDYNAHMTISYLQRGTAEKYHKELSEPFTLIPKEYKYSYADGRTEFFTI